MRFELLGDWPASRGASGICIPAGTVLDGNDLQWNGVPLRAPLPLNVKALDVDAANALVRWHPHNQNLLRFAAGIKPTLEIKV